MHTYIANGEDDTANFLAKTMDMDRYIHNVIAVCDYIKAKKRGRKDINISFDEWNVWYHAFADNNAYNARREWETAPAYNEDIYTFQDALVVGSMLITLMRYAHRVKIACQAQLVNVIAPIMTVPGGPAWRQTIYWPYLHASLYGRGTALQTLIADAPKYDSKDYTDVPVLDSIAVANENGDWLTIFAVNRGEDDLDISCCLRDFPGCSVSEHIVMASPDLKATNSADAPNKVVPATSSRHELRDGTLHALAPGYSWNVIRVNTSIYKFWR
jgi:alpha-N-arabinofuranosidase